MYFLFVAKLSSNMVTLALFVGFVALVQVGSAFEIKLYSDGNSAKIESIHISACPEATGDHCVISLESNVTYVITFETGMCSEFLSPLGAIGESIETNH